MPVPKKKRDWEQPSDPCIQAQDQTFIFIFFF